MLSCNEQIVTKSQLHLRHCNKESFGRDERIQPVPEGQVSRGNDVFFTSVGRNELLYYVQLLGLLLFAGGNKVLNPAACFHSLRTICNRRLKGRASHLKLWDVFHAHIAAPLGGMNLTRGSRGLCAMRSPQPMPKTGKAVAKYIWQNRMNFSEGINLANLTASGF